MPVSPEKVQGEWTLYDARGRVLVPFDTFFRLGFSKEARVAEKPVERGGFVSYNKTESPAKVTVRLGKSGPPRELAEYLAALDKAMREASLVSVVTPEKVYLDVTAMRCDFDRSAENGRDRVIVDLTLQEIRQVQARYTTAATSARSPRQSQDGGTLERGKQQPERDLSVMQQAGRGFFAWLGLGG